MLIDEKKIADDKARADKAAATKAAAAKKEAEAPPPILVRAIATGYYGDTIRRPGDEFYLAYESEMGDWMEVVDRSNTPDQRAQLAADKAALAEATEQRQRNEALKAANDKLNTP